MAPPSFRLDTLAVLYIARLEATRRAHADNPAAATEAIARVTAELVAAQAAECRAVMGDEDQARRIQREGLDTFLPRYTRLALEQNREEARGGPIPDNVLARTAAAVVGLAAATVLMEVFANPADLLFYAIPLAAPFLPEIKAWSSRRRYASRLQELADDLGELQDAEDKLASTLTVPDPPAASARSAPPVAARADSARAESARVDVTGAPPPSRNG